MKFKCLVKKCDYKEKPYGLCYTKVYQNVVNRWSLKFCASGISSPCICQIPKKYTKMKCQGSDKLDSQQEWQLDSNEVIFCGKIKGMFKKH